MSIRKQIFLLRQSYAVRANPHTVVMTLLSKGASFEFAAKFVARHA